MAKAARTGILLLAIAVLATAVPAFAQSSAAGSRAILTRGTLAVRGVPHFPSNAIGALYGEYRWGESTVRVWVIKEELFLSKDWTEYPLRSAGGTALRAFKKNADSGDAAPDVYALQGADYWTLLELPSSSGNPREFIPVFSSRLAYFAAHPSAASGLSLPAVLEIR